MWKSLSIDSKKVFQKLLFSEGIYYNREKDRVRTPWVNSLFKLISNISSDLKGNKKTGIINFDNSRTLVTPMIQSSNFLLRELEELKNLSDYLKAA